MGITNLYQNLPGNLVQFKDGGLSSRTNSAVSDSGKSILILGTAVDGIVNEPVAVDIETIESVFGTDSNGLGYSNGSTLVKSAKQAAKGGFTDIRCMRVTGKQASCEVKKTITSSTTKKAAKENLGTINGNDAITDYVLSKGPIVDDSLNMTVVTTAGTSVVGYQNLRTYSKKVNINANIVSAGADVTANYTYKNIKAKKDTEVTLTKTGASFDVIAITDDVYQTIAGVLEDSGNTGQDIYGYTFVDAAKCPVTVTVKTGKTVAAGTVLEAGTGFTWDAAAKTITVSDSVSLEVDDVLTISYVPYETAVMTETITLGATAQKFALEHEPVAGTEKVYIGSSNTAVAENSGWSYGATKTEIVIDPSKFNISDAIKFEYEYNLTVSSADNFVVSSVNGGALYNNANLQIVAFEKDGVQGRKIILTKPQSKLLSKTEKPMEFTSFDFPTVGILCYAINNATINNVFTAYSDNDNSTTNDLPLTSMNLVGGEDGINPSNNELFEALSGKRNTDGYLTEQGAYQLLENYRTDMVYVGGIYADMEQTSNLKSSFHMELALLCAVLTYRTKMTHGFIDMKPNSNPTLKGVQEHFKKLKSYKNVLYMTDPNTGDVITDSDNKAMDIGWYTSVCAGPDPIVVSDTLGTYYGSSALAYAATINGLSAESSPTNKKVVGIKGLRYHYSNAQMNDLVGNRMVTFMTKNSGSDAYVVDGITAGAPGCDYARITTVRVLTEVVDQIREVADPFIGEPNTVEQRNALSALISKRLSYLKEQGVILHYAFDIYATAEMIRVGECSLQLEIVAPQDLRKITTTVALKAAS